MSTPAGDDDDEQNWVDEPAPPPRAMSFFSYLQKAANFLRPTPPPPPPPYLTPPTTSTPINTLPAELLADIFQLGQEVHAELHAEEHSEVDEIEEHEFMPFEILASHVCKRWRDVALGTPSLWTFVDFGEGPPFERSIAYLERSREAPLDLVIDCDEDDDSDDDYDVHMHEREHGDGNETEEVSEDEGEEIVVLPEPENVPPPPPSPPDTMSSLASRGRTRSSDGGSTHKASNDGKVRPEDLPTVRDLILPHASRWRSFDFSASSYAVVHGILHALAALPELPTLEVLELRHYEGNEDEDDNEHFPHREMIGPVLPFNGKAPRIKSICLWGVHLDWEKCDFLKSPTLEHLELAYHALDVRPSYAVFQSILTSAPLIALKLTSSSPSEPPTNWPTGKISVPTLQALTLGQLSPPHVAALLTRLHLPSCKYLALDFDPDDHSGTLEILSHPTQGLARGLESLKINGLHASSAARKTFYGALTGLKELRMQTHHLPEHFVQALIPNAVDTGDSDNEDPLPANSNGTLKKHKLALPMLNSLAVMGLDGDVIRAIVESRRHAGAPLETLMVERGDAVTDEDDVWLRKNVDDFGYYDDSEDEDVDEFDVEDGVEVDMDVDDDELGSGSEDEDGSEGEGEAGMQIELDVD